MAGKRISIVGIGASAGGLEAIRLLLNAVLPSGQLAFLVAQHISPRHRSMLVDLLGKGCKLMVVEARDGQTLEADTVYVNPPSKDILVYQGKLALRDHGQDLAPTPSVNRLFASLAGEFGNRSVGVVLSGTGSDGAQGCLDIRSAGGITIAQDPVSAKYDSMPVAALQKEAVDFVLAPEDIAARLPDIVRSPRSGKATEQPQKDPQLSSLDELVERIYRVTRVDFRQYKKATLARQLERRFGELGLENPAGYLAFVDKNPDELRALQRSFLISVTQFFRDAASFEKIKTLMDQLLERKAVRSSLRIWVPGCATGEEVYSLAILLLECLGSRISDYDVKLFGTDIDDAATAVARRGSYPGAAMDGVQPDHLQRYFIREGDDYKLIKRVRELCVFGRQDLISDPPFLKMDMISCRNLMIYLNNDMQNQVINNFHYSLLPGGLLFLGNSESVGNMGSQYFSAIDSKNKIYKSREDVATRIMINGFASKQVQPARKNIKPSKQKRAEAINQCLIGAYSPPSVLLNASYSPVQFFGEASRFLRFPENIAEFDVLTLTPPEIRTELRSLLHRAFKGSDSRLEHLVDRKIKDERTRLRLVVRWQGWPTKPEKIKDERTRLRLVVRRVYVDNQLDDNLLLSFETVDSAPSNTVPDTLAGGDLEYVKQLENELSGTREHLQAVIQVLETSNDELQSLNEELQASTEELETTNEELQAANDELLAKSDELGGLNETLANIQESINMGLVVLDKKLRLLRYTPKVIRLFGILPSDLGQRITGIPAHIEVEALEQVLGSVIASGEPVSMEVPRQSDTFVMSVSPYLNQNREISGVILTFSDISELTRTREQVRQSENKFQLIADSLHEVVWMSSSDFRQLEYVSPAFAQYTGASPEAPVTVADYVSAIHPDDRDAFVAAVSQPRWDISYRMLHANQSLYWLRDRGARVHDQARARDVLVSSAIDITNAVQIARELERSESRFRGVFEKSSIGIVLTDPAGRITDVNPFFCDWLDFTRAELLAMTASQLVHSDDRDQALAIFDKVAREQDFYHLEQRYLTRSGGEVHGLLSASIARNSDITDEGDLAVIWVIQDISEQVRARREIYQQANFDSLTALPNRALVLDRIQQAVEHSRRNASELCVLFIDLDGFKEVNDANGHDVGDEVLKEMSSRIRGSVRSSDTVGRFGGDEFVALLSGFHQKKPLGAVIQKILQACRKPIFVKDKKFTLSCSIGASISPRDSQSSTELIQFADTAMYRVKKQGGDSFVYFSPEMNDSVQLLSGIKHDLLSAINRNELFLVYQPIFNTVTNEFDHAETLVRWHNPEVGVIYPDQFIPIAEKSYLIEQLDIWVFRTAAKFLRRHPGLVSHLGINITGRTLNNQQFFKALQKNADVLPRVCFELTERILFDGDGDLKDKLRLIQSYGAKIGLDDFGVGFSNLSQIQSNPLDVIKVDKLFTDEVVQAEDEHPLIDSIYSISDALGTQVIVEGVETATQAEYFKQRGSTLIQGYYYAKPMKEKELLAFVAGYMADESSV